MQEGWCCQLNLNVQHRCVTHLYGGAYGGNEQDSAASYFLTKEESRYAINAFDISQDRREATTLTAGSCADILCSAAHNRSRTMN